MTNTDIHKSPRLYLKEPLQDQTQIDLDPGHVHYLGTVLRKDNDTPVRVFNGADGEWLARFEKTGKKTGRLNLEAQLKPQTENAPKILIFAPMKKNRLDWMIEKAVELGVTELHPVITAHTENRHLNLERIDKQIIEASEQCERLNLPQIAAPRSLQEWIRDLDYQVAACLTRQEGIPHLKDTTLRACLIGPEGGFSDQETEQLLGHPMIEAVSLGPHILRAETAALAALVQLALTPALSHRERESF